MIKLFKLLKSLNKNFHVRNYSNFQFLHRSAEVLCALAMSQFSNGEYANACATFDKLHRLEPAYTNKMDLFAYLLYIDKSDRDKLNSLEK